MFHIKRYSIFAVLGIMALPLFSCGPATLPTAHSNEPVTLKIAVLPVLDTLPMYVAQQEGLFEARGVKVEFIPVGSAPERDQLVSAGQADGMVNEILSAMFFNRDQVQVQVVRYAQAASSDSALFSIVASGKNDIDQIAELKGVEIGVSQGTVIEYLTDRLLQAEGFSVADVRVVAVPKIDLRMSLLNSGELKAGMLPEPLTSLAVLQGGRVVLDDRLHPEYSFSTISFRKAVIDRHPEAIRGFLAAIEEATDRINAAPESFAGLLVEQKLLPAPLAGQYKLSRYVKAGVPTEQQWKDTLVWAQEKGLLNKDLSYSDTVRADFLP
jgi:NitT/TauT family transport system substrate-binding protein